MRAWVTFYCGWQWLSFTFSSYIKYTVQQYMCIQKLVRSDATFYVLQLVYRTMEHDVHNGKRAFSCVCLCVYTIHIVYGTCCLLLSCAVFEHFAYKMLSYLVNGMHLCVGSHENDIVIVNWLVCVRLCQHVIVKWWTYCFVFQCQLVNF